VRNRLDCDAWSHEVGSGVSLGVEIELLEG
jgi:hypothetical protein